MTGQLKQYCRWPWWLTLLMLSAWQLAANRPATASAQQVSSAIPLEPYLQPDDFSGYTDRLMPMVNLTYRIYRDDSDSSPLLPLTAPTAATIRNLLVPLFQAYQLVVSVDVQPALPAPVITKAPALLSDSCPATVVSPSPDPAADASARYDEYQALDVRVYVRWSANSSMVRLGGSIEATYNTFLEQRLAGVGLKARVMSTHLIFDPEACSILSRLPMLTFSSYTIVLQLIGPGLIPFDVRKQTATAAIFRQQLVQIAGVPYAHIAAIAQAQAIPADSCSVGSDDPESLGRPLDVVNVTFVASNQVASAMPLADAVKLILGQAQIFQAAMAAIGLPVSTRVLSIDPLPGESITDTIRAHISDKGVSTSAAQPSPGHQNRPLAPADGSVKRSTGTSQRTAPQLPMGLIVGGVATGAAIAVATGLLLWGRGANTQHRPAPRSSKETGVARDARYNPFGSAAKHEHGLDEVLPVPSVRFEQGNGAASMTEFQKAAIGAGIWGPSELGHKPIPTGNRSSSLSAGKSGGSKASASSSSGDGLTDHPAAGFVHWDIAEGDIEVCRHPDGSDWVLGEGSYGLVYRALRSGVHDVAVKVLSRMDDGHMQQFRKEISLLKSLNFNRNIVQFYGACLYGGRPLLVQEFMEGGDLRKALAGPFAEELRWYRKGQIIALDIARGLHFLHNNKVMHSDLKSANVLLSKDFVCAKIGDVGLARIMSTGYFTDGQLGGTFQYAAPELLLNGRCTEKVDIYSFGVVLWELVTGEMPQRGRLHDLQVPEQCPASVQELMTECLTVDPTARPTAKDLFCRIREALSDGPGVSFGQHMSDLSDWDLGAVQEQAS